MSFAIIMILTVICTSYSAVGIKVYKEGNGRLSCRTQSYEHLELEWLTNGTVIKNSTKFSLTEDYIPKFTSTLAINDVTVHDEAIYTCRIGDQSCSYNLHAIPQPKSSTKSEEVIDVVYTGEPINIDCNTLIGRLTIEDSCIFISLRFNTADSDDLSTFKDGQTKNSPGFNLSQNLQDPSFNVSMPHRSHYQYQCIVLHDDAGDNCPGLTFETLNGPVYNIFYPPSVSISSNYTDTVPEGSVLSINCTVIDENVNYDPDYSIDWSVINSDTQEHYTNLSIHGDNREILYLSAKSDVDVSCNVFGEIKDMELRNASSSMHISVAPNTSVHILSEQCGTVTIMSKTANGQFPTDIMVTIDEETSVLIKKGSTDKTISIENTTEIILSTVVNGVSGNSDRRNIPKCIEAPKTVVLNLSVCDTNGPVLTDDQIKEFVSSLLQNVTEFCKLDVCPKFNEHNWEIVSTSSDCTVNIDINNVPRTSAIQDFCQYSNKCQIKDPEESTTNPPTSSGVSMTVVWIGIGVSCGLIIILIVVLLYCLVYKIRKIKIRNGRSDDPERGQVTPVSLTTRRGEQNETLSVPNNNPTISITPPRSDRHSQAYGYCNTSMASHSTNYSNQSHDSRQTKHSTSSSLSRYIDTETGRAITITEIIEQLTNLGGHISENTTQISADTGLGSASDNQNSILQTRSERSSGYEGSHAPVQINNDPNILNPHGMSGYSEASNSSSCSTSSSRNSFENCSTNTKVYYKGTEPHHYSQV